MSKKTIPLPPPPDPGIQLPLTYREIPDKWEPTNDWDSHRPLLYRVIMNTPHQYMYEFGIGEGSTPLLIDLYENVYPHAEYYSFENDWQWFELFLNVKYQKNDNREHSYISRNHCLTYTNHMPKWVVFKDSIVFIDNAPGEERNSLLSKHANYANVVIVHDTETGAEYVYHMADMLSKYKFRIDLVIEGMPQTTAVSNFFNFDAWRGIVNDKYQFI